LQSFEEKQNNGGAIEAQWRRTVIHFSFFSLLKSLQLKMNLKPLNFREESMRKRDIRLTRIAIAIVGVFMICHLPR